jgi:WD40 repeat protein
MRVLQSQRPRPLDRLALGAGGRVAAACSVFGVRGDVDVWDLASSRLALAYPRESKIGSLAFTPDGGSFLLSESNNVIGVVDVAKGREVTSLGVGLGDPEFAVSSDGTRLFASSVAGQFGAISCWAVGSPVTFSQVWFVGPNEWNYAAPAFHPDSRRLAVGVRNSWRGKETIHLRAAADGRILKRIPGDPADPVYQLAFSADGSLLLARYHDRAVKLFDAATATPAGELVHPGRPYVTGVAVHPGGTVACSRTNGTVCLWDLRTRELTRTLDWKLGKLVSVAFAPDGSVGAAGTEDGRVVVWDVDG